MAWTVNALFKEVTAIPIPMVAAHNAQPIKAWTRRIVILDAFIVLPAKGIFKSIEMYEVLLFWCQCISRTIEVVRKIGLLFSRLFCLYRISLNITVRKLYEQNIRDKNKGRTVIEVLKPDESTIIQSSVFMMHKGMGDPHNFGFI